MVDIQHESQILEKLPLAIGLAGKEPIQIKLLFSNRLEIIQIPGKPSFLEGPLFGCFSLALERLWNFAKEVTSNIEKLPKVLSQKQAYEVQTAVDTRRLYDFVSYVVCNEVKLTPSFLNYALSPIHNSMRLRIMPSHDYPLLKMRKLTKEGIQLYEQYLSDYKETAYPSAVTVSSLMEICLCTLDWLAELNLTIKRCECCGLSFVPLHRSDEKYCSFDHTSFGGKRCKDVAKLSKQKDREANNEITNLSKRIYNRLRARKERAEEKEDYGKYKEFDDALLMFVDDKNDWKKAVDTGTKSGEDFVKWLRAKETETK